MDKGAPDRRHKHRDLRQAHQTFHDGERAMLGKRVLKRLRHLESEKLIRKVSERARKWLQLRRTQHPIKEKLPVFIVGCNRSGTNMVCAAIGKSPHGLAFQESLFSLAFEGYYLRPAWILEWLIRITPAAIISFGSILDSQFADDLLSRFDDAKAIWVYRRYEDVVNSCARMQWGKDLKDLVRWVARGELEKLGARGERISADTVRLFDKLFRKDLSDEDSAALYWYMRNQLYFDLKLYTNARVLLVQYEDTVLHKERAFGRIFDFLGLPYHHSVTDGIFASSVGKHTWPVLDPAIKEVCDALQVRLDRQYARTSDRLPTQFEFQVPEAKKLVGL